MRASFYTPALILAPNLNIFQRILSQPSVEDIIKFPTLETKSKIKIQKEKLIFVHAPQSENSLKIGAHLRKFSQNRSELISENSKIGAHLISNGLICGGQLSHLRRQASHWSTEHSSPPHFPITGLSFSVCFPRNYGNYIAELSIQVLVFSLSIGRYFSSSPSV